MMAVMRLAHIHVHNLFPTIAQSAYNHHRETIVCVLLLVGECSAFLASGSDPTDERCMKHGPQTRRELAACALTER